MRNSITVRDVMNREFVGVSESDRLVEAAELMASEPTAAVVVVRGSEPIGSLSTSAALAALLDGDPGDRTVGEVMEPPVPAISPDAALAEGTQQLVSHGSTHLLVVDEDDEIVGLLTERDVLAARETVETTAVGNRSGGGETAEMSETAEMGEPVGEETNTESIQGICEGCGSLSPDLVTVNGQLMCPDCRAY